VKSIQVSFGNASSSPKQIPTAFQKPSPEFWDALGLSDRGKIWWYKFWFEGRRIQESSGFTNKRKAKDAEAVRRAKLLERRAGITRKELPPKLEEFVTVFLAWSKQTHRLKTYELHATNCDVLKRYFAAKWLDEITPGMVEDFKLARIREKRWGEDEEQTVSGSTVNRALSTLRLMFNYAAEKCEYQVPNPVKGVEFFEESGKMRVISLAEEIAYLASASQPLKDIARMILDTRMRPEEVFRIEVANLDFIGRTIFNPFGKTRAARRKLTMTEDVFAILKGRCGGERGICFRVAGRSNAADRQRSQGARRRGASSTYQSGIPPLRPPAHIRVTRRDGGSGPSDTRSAPRPYKHSNDHAVRSSRRRTQTRGGGEAREFQRDGSDEAGTEARTEK
jgi:integrase